MRTVEVKRRYRTVFLSDIHLGTRGCRADFLLDFLRRTDCERLYLVGDVVDGWRLRKSWHWTEEFDDVLRHVLGMAKRGTEVVYIPGTTTRCSAPGSAWRSRACGSSAKPCTARPTGGACW